MFVSSYYILTNIMDSMSHFCTARVLPIDIATMSLPTMEYSPSKAM